MAADLAAPIREQRTARGMGQIKPEQGLNLLGRILRQDETHLGVLPIEWPKYLRQFSEISPFFADLVGPEPAPVLTTQPTPEPDSVLQQLTTTPSADRPDLLRSHIRGKVAKALGVGESHLAVDRSLLELGVDSLMALELRNRITTDLKVDLPIVKFMEGPTIAQIAELLLKQLKNDLTESLEPVTTPVHQPHINENAVTDDDWEEGEL